MYKVIEHASAKPEELEEEINKIAQEGEWKLVCFSGVGIVSVWKKA